MQIEPSGGGAAGETVAHDDAQRYESEREFHNRAFTEDVRERAAKYYEITKPNRDYYFELLGQRCSGKRCLEYGCGPGSAAFFLAHHGGIVTGIDISDVAVAQAEQDMARRGLPGTFHCMNAEATHFPDGSFDLICGTGILHHLDLERAYAELARLLAGDGYAVFIEPLGHNPAINLYRRLTPALRTEDEHPLKASDLKLARQFFQRVELRFFHLSSLAAVAFRKTPFFQAVRGTLEFFDQRTFALLPFMRRYAWVVVMSLAEPRF